MLLQHEEFVAASTQFSLSMWAKETLDLSLAVVALGSAGYLVKIISDLAALQ
jgi:hypothetical protein